jgi:hypothetical protein
VKSNAIVVAKVCSQCWYSGIWWYFMEVLSFFVSLDIGGLLSTENLWWGSGFVTIVCSLD